MRIMGEMVDLDVSAGIHFGRRTFEERLVELPLSTEMTWVIRPNAADRGVVAFERSRRGVVWDAAVDWTLTIRGTHIGIMGPVGELPEVFFAGNICGGIWGSNIDVFTDEQVSKLYLMFSSVDWSVVREDIKKSNQVVKSHTGRKDK